MFTRSQGRRCRSCAQDDGRLCCIRLHRQDRAASCASPGPSSVLTTSLYDHCELSRPSLPKLRRYSSLQPRIARCTQGPVCRARALFSQGAENAGVRENKPPRRPSRAALLLRAARRRRRERALNRPRQLWRVRPFARPAEAVAQRHLQALLSLPVPPLPALTPRAGPAATMEQLRAATEATP